MQIKVFLTLQVDDDEYPVPVDGELKDFNLRWHEDAALTVVLASKGYPNAFEKPFFIAN